MDLENPQPPKDIFILSGQSNMAGRGGVDQKNKHFNGVIQPECQSNPCILRLDCHLEWEPAAEPLHYDIDTQKTCGVGPGMAFANAVKHMFTTVGLVPCAIGGTTIKEWARGTQLYEDMVKRAKFAAAEMGEIRALLWYQGESDTRTLHDAMSYKNNMEKLIESVRSDLDLPLLPVIQVAIASGCQCHIETVREAQKSIDQPNVICVDAKGLPLMSDNLHLTTTAQVQLGIMLADAYLSHFAPPTQPPF